MASGLSHSPPQLQGHQSATCQQQGEPRQPPVDGQGGQQRHRQQNAEAKRQVQGCKGQRLLATHAGQQGQQGAATGEKGDELETIGNIVSHLFATCMHDVSPSVDGSSVREGRLQRQRDNSIALNEQFLITRYGGL
ncbi:hypothetical protein A6767_17640 [Aeromonas veronii]|nr:hypothetical protein A6767_17640 [Aeromonas veronii]